MSCDRNGGCMRCTHLTRKDNKDFVCLHKYCEGVHPFLMNNDCKCPYYTPKKRE